MWTGLWKYVRYMLFHSWCRNLKLCIFKTMENKVISLSSHKAAYSGSSVNNSRFIRICVQNLNSLTKDLRTYFSTRHVSIISGIVYLHNFQTLFSCDVWKDLDLLIQIMFPNPWSQQLLVHNSLNTWKWLLLHEFHLI